MNIRKAFAISRACFFYWVCFLCAALMLAACGGDTPSLGSESAADESATNQEALPGSEEFGLSKAELVASIEEVENLIAQCMSEAGFEYIATDYNTVRAGMVADKTLPGMGEEAFIAQYGFGISTLYTGLAPQQADLTIPAKIGLGQQNVQIFNNLSAVDQDAYNHTLFGENQDATFAVALETEDFSRTGGCTRAAIEKVFAPEQLNVSYRNPKDALIEEDPRMVEAIARFGECMRDAGFDYNHEHEVEPDLRDRLYAITEGAPLEALSADAKAALAALQAEEMAIAAATVACEEKHLDPVEDQVERELFARRDQQ
ncbi:MAG: hypothetical protein R3293_18230 [Candidatus Promineifilaceae bacterium]|nr:hypothetical protein [Candidatus Promineifilaceae bacterium]